MYLPPNVLYCIEKLENAGYATYAVGGCVRDACLGHTPHDYDLCTAATPDVTAAIFAHHNLVKAGEKHGTIGVVLDKEVIEITTFRTEGAYTDSRHPQWVSFVPDIERDLARRDFTVNAMAYSPSRGFADPFGGQADLKNHILRAVGDPFLRFTEDALRILRGVRFAVRFGLSVESETQKAMENLASRMEFLAKERIFDELCKLLPLVQAEDLLRFAPIVTTVIPELADTIGFDQRSNHHAYDIFTHTAYVVESVPRELTLRWAALLHDIGKPTAFTRDATGRGHFKGHAQLGGQIADEALRQLHAPDVLRERVVFLVSHHMMRLGPDEQTLRSQLQQYGPDAIRQLLTLQQADFHSKGVPGDGDGSMFIRLRQLLDTITADTLP